MGIVKIEPSSITRYRKCEIQLESTVRNGERTIRRSVCGLILILLLTNMLALTYHIQPVKSDYVWTGTIYIRADGSIDPPDAPISTVDNVTYILTGNITITYDADGIVIERDNTIVDGAGYTVQGTGAWSFTGIVFTKGSKVTIKNTNVKHFSRGISLYGSSNNIIVGNNITENGDGVWLSSSDIYGDYLGSSSNNSIVGNNIANNKQGIWIDWSSNIRFWHNNFIDNTQQVHVETSIYANVWDDGYPSGGNHWSNYGGVDEKSGPNQDLPGIDGIGDTPYTIDENNRDRYPLINPWTPPDHGLAVSITAPFYLQLGSSTLLNATVTNEGLNDEVNVELPFLINDTTVNSTIISLLQAGNSYTLNYHWTPTVEGTYNVTAYAPPVPGEALTQNNQQTVFVNVSASEIVVSIIAPASLRVGASSSLNATVNNQGRNNETNVELWLLINGSIMNSTTISLLQPSDSYTLSYLWTTTVEGTYNVTAYASPVPGETSSENNLVTEFVTVTGSLPPGKQVGVKAGDWIKVDYTVAGAPPGTTLPLWLKVEFLSVEGTNATVRVTMRMSDGTEQNATLSVDVVAGGQAFGLSGFVIPANCTTGDSIYMSGYGNVTIAGEATRSYAGASRTVVYAGFSQYGTQLTYYWDKQTGVIVEASTTSGTMTGTGKATETNMWQAAPSGLPIEPIYLYILVALAIIVAVGAAAFIVRRKKKPPEKVES